jgi:hypothetical protein
MNEGHLIGILADSLGDLDAFGAAYELLLGLGAERFFFAGGRYSDLDDWIAQKRRAASQVADAQALLRLEDKFVRAPERDSPNYADPKVGKKVLDMLGEVLCCIVHDKNDLDREDLLNASIFFHGKGAEPKVVRIGPRFFITPGQLSGAAQQTCGLIQRVDRDLLFSAFALDGQRIVDQRLPGIQKRSKLSIK